MAKAGWQYHGFASSSPILDRWEVFSHCQHPYVTVGGERMHLQGPTTYGQSSGTSEPCGVNEIDIMLQL